MNGPASFHKGAAPDGKVTHLLEGKLPHQLQAHHDHPRHPEEEDVVSRLKQHARVEHL